MGTYRMRTTFCANFDLRAYCDQKKNGKLVHITSIQTISKVVICHSFFIFDYKKKPFQLSSYQLLSPSEITPILIEQIL